MDISYYGYIHKDIDFSVTIEKEILTTTFNGANDMPYWIIPFDPKEKPASLPLGPGRQILWSCYCDAEGGDIGGMCSVMYTGVYSSDNHQEAITCRAINCRSCKLSSSLGVSLASCIMIQANQVRIDGILYTK